VFFALSVARDIEPSRPFNVDHLFMPLSDRPKDDAEVVAMIPERHGRAIGDGPREGRVQAFNIGLNAQISTTEPPTETNY